MKLYCVISNDPSNNHPHEIIAGITPDYEEAYNWCIAQTELSFRIECREIMSQFGIFESIPMVRYGVFKNVG